MDSYTFNVSKLTYAEDEVSYYLDEGDGGRALVTSMPDGNLLRNGTKGVQGNTDDHENYV